MEVTYISKTPVYAYNTTWCHNPEDHNVNYYVYRSQPVHSKPILGLAAFACDLVAFNYQTFLKLVSGILRGAKDIRIWEK
jgi:hypothetical protein